MLTSICEKEKREVDLIEILVEKCSAFEEGWGHIYLGMALAWALSLHIGEFLGENKGRTTGAGKMIIRTERRATTQIGRAHV